MNGMLYVRLQEVLSKVSNLSRKENPSKYETTKLMVYVRYFRNRSLIVSPTASGKSLIIYALTRYYQMAGLKTLILVPTTSLVEQMYSDFEDYGWSSGTYCQRIYQGHDTRLQKT